MDPTFLLNEEQKLLRDTVRSFARNEVVPRAAEIDRTAEFPFDLYKRMADLGLLGLMVPEEGGGSGGDTVMQGLVQEELGYASATVADIQAAALEVALTLHEHAPEEIRERYVPRIIVGDVVPAFALTEPTAGSDAAGIKTTADRDGDKFVINGNKQWVTSGKAAEFAIVMAITDRTKQRQNLSAILVDLSTPGVSVGRSEDLVGIRGTATASISFSDCRVPVTNIIGEEGRGLRLGLSQFDKGRISTAAMAVGIAQAAFDAAFTYARNRVQFGQPIFEFQGVQFKLAQMAMRLDAARLLYLTAAMLRDRGENSVRAASEAKLFASDAATWITDEVIQVFAGYGYVRDNPVERYWRDAKIAQIFEGTSNIQHIVIARELAKEVK
jgi:alkylation response protein AidB-like acyl-CoA dehydrogenase